MMNIRMCVKNNYYSKLFSYFCYEQKSNLFLKNL
jgi:hypothetical protein